MEHVNAPVSAGIQQLVDTLKKEGVAAGQEEALRIVAEAEARAAEVEEGARKKAEQLLADAEKEADFVKKAGQHALDMASRDAVLSLKSFLEGAFCRHLTHGVETAMTDTALLEKMILAVASRNAVDPASGLEISVPGIMADEGGKAAFVSEQTRSLLDPAVTFTVDNSTDAGLTFHLKDQDVEVSLTRESVSQMLLRHLQPRFRAMLDGKGL